MRKILLLSFLLSFLSISYHTQAQDNDGPFVGVTTALNSTWIIIDDQPDDSNLEYKKNWKWAPVGAVIGYKFNENHSLQLEAIKSHQGADFDIEDESGNIIGEKRIDLKYWAFPLLFKYSTAGKARFNFHLGPQLSFLTYGREENKFTGTGQIKVEGQRDDVYGPKNDKVFASFKDTDDNAPQNPNVGSFSTVDPAIAFGFGGEFNLTPNFYLSANLRFNYAFKEIRDKEYFDDKDDVENFVMRYNVLGGVQVGLHYFINKSE